MTLNDNPLTLCQNFGDTKVVPKSQNFGDTKVVPKSQNFGDTKVVPKSQNFGDTKVVPKSQNFGDTKVVPKSQNFGDTKVVPRTDFPRRAGRQNSVVLLGVVKLSVHGAQGAHYHCIHGCRVSFSPRVWTVLLPRG